MVASIFSTQQPGFAGSPSALFANSEPGLWLDPSDLSTMFQDVAGTIPVTTPGQTVALILDKSRGLQPGPELRQNGVPLLLGVAPVATYDPLTGVGSCNRVDVGNLSYARFIGVAGNTYIVDLENKATSGGAVSLRTNVFNDVIQSLNPGQRRKFYFVCVGADFRVTPNTNGTSVDFTVHSVNELPGNHATQATGPSRPTYQIDGSGRGYLFFDGVDDGLATGTITPGTSTSQMVIGATKNNITTSAPFEYGVNSSTTPGSVGLIFSTPNLAPNFQFRSTGSNIRSVTGVDASAGTTMVITGLADTIADYVTLRRDAVLIATGAGGQGGGLYANQVVYIGRRAGTTLPTNMNLYGFLLRFGPALNDAQIAATEAWMNRKTGAY